MVADESSRAYHAILLLLAIVALACPTRPTWPYDVQRGCTLADHTDGEGAAERLRLAVSEAERDGARPWGVPISLYYLADVYLRYPRLERTAEASALLERSEKQWERLVGPTDPAVAVVLVRLSQAKRIEGDGQAAGRLEQRADAIVKKSLSSHHPARRLRENGVPLEEALEPGAIFAETVGKLGGVLP
jgi:hypothetical protein